MSATVKGSNIKSRDFFINLFFKAFIKKMATFLLKFKLFLLFYRLKKQFKADFYNIPLFSVSF